MPKEQNKEKVKDLKEKLTEAKSVIFAEYTGLNANRMNELRKQIRSEGAELNISKNTLMKIALSKENHNGDIAKNLKGQMMALFSYEDAISPLKKLVEFAREHETPSVRIGLFEGNVITAEKIVELSELPSKKELLARVVGGLKSPLSGIANVLGGTQRNFVYALSAIAEKKGETE
jgi:large subunit ribosomal protein L10